MKDYLNFEGLSQFLDKLLTKFATKKELESKADVVNGQYAVTASSSDGVAYIATVPSIESLTSGVSFIMIPSKASTSVTPTLNVNGLGAKSIKRRLSSISTATQSGYSASWLAANKPFRIVYDGSQWIVEGNTKPVAEDLYGTAPKAKADSEGNVITETYATKTELESYLPKVTTISLPATNWVGDSNPYFQIVTETVNGITENSKIDLQPTAMQVVELQDMDIALMIENNDGTIIVYALGGKPTIDYEMQILITEVTVV